MLSSETRTSSAVHDTVLPLESRPGPRTGLPDLVVLVSSVSSGIVGGILEYLEPLKRNLPREGVSVLSFEFPRTLNLMESRGLPRPLRTGLHAMFILWTLLRILLARRRYRTILVHSHGASYAMITGFLARAYGHLAIHTFHSPISRPSAALRLLSGRLDGLVFVSRGLGDRLRSLTGVDHSSVDYIPGAADVQALVPLSAEDRTAERKNVLAASGLPDRGHLALFLGRITPEKGILELVEAVRFLRESRCPVAVLVAGPFLDSRAGEAYRSLVERKIDDLGVSEWIALAGPVARPQKARFIGAADVFVCPSEWESSPIAVVEALSCGVPVVAFRAGGLGERIVDGEDGILVEPGDTVGLARAVEGLVRDESRRRAMAERAREEALRHYSVRSLVEQHLNLYARTLASRNASRE